VHSRHGPPPFQHGLRGTTGSQVHILCVGTPQKQGEYAADLRFVEDAI
jgi:UDPglucose 6-dehydrogenase